MSVLLLGATGRTGRHILERLLDKGHTVNTLVRDKNKLSCHVAQLNIFEGLPTDRAALTAAMEGCDTVISALNISRTSDFPWAKLRTPPTFLSDTMTNILETADETGIKKIVLCSAWGVLETRQDIPFWFRWLLDNSNIGVAYRNHEWQERLLQNSGFNFTIVRPVGLTNSLKERTILVSQNNVPIPALTISRRNTAHFMVEMLDCNQFDNQAVVISEKR
jgi:uncharacterized protein YbjT (DUF2867 family)